MDPIMIIHDLEGFEPPENKPVILFYDLYLDRIGNAWSQQVPSGFHPAWGHGDQKTISQKLVGLSPVGVANTLWID